MFQGLWLCFIKLMSQTLVLASSNRGKLQELHSLLAPLGWDVRSQTDFHVPDADETGLSFVENALIKARHAAQLTGLPAIADDSGLCVPALQGAPGIYSARYAGEPSSDARNNARLLVELSTKHDRRAYYYCALVWVQHAADPTPLIATAAWHGEILTTPQGDGGFGYDPLFWVDSENCTAAQLPSARKNTLSHRGQALRALLAQVE